jgi:hypothetical protein
MQVLTRYILLLAELVKQTAKNIDHYLRVGWLAVVQFVKLNLVYLIVAIVIVIE